MALRNRLNKAVFSALVLGVHTLASGSAEAKTCEDNQDCAQGFVCEVVGGSACPGQACPPNSECEPLPPCEPEVFKECVPGPCERDADCPVDMVCLSSTSESCAGTSSACAPGEECPPPPPPECETRTKTQCAPKYMAPCTADADCGAGFTCVEAEQCSCSGGTPMPTPAPGTEPQPADGAEPSDSMPPADQECSCTKTGTKRCEAQEITCSDAAQCPEGWTCEAGDVASVDCPPAREGEPAPICEQPQPAEHRCLPPYYGTPGISADDAFGTPTTGSPESPTAPGESRGSANSPDGAAANDSDSGGCQLGAGAAHGTASAFLLLLGLIGLTRRRSVRS